MPEIVVYAGAVNAPPGRGKGNEYAAAASSGTPGLANEPYIWLALNCE